MTLSTPFHGNLKINLFNYWITPLGVDNNDAMYTNFGIIRDFITVIFPYSKRPLTDHIFIRLLTLSSLSMKFFSCNSC